MLFVSAFSSFASDAFPQPLTWMNAVAIITPDPKNFATKNTLGGTFVPRFLAANTGKQAPEFRDSGSVGGFLARES